MISVIVCSQNTNYLLDLINNIADTIGVTYEIIAFDNRVENKSIAAVYNEQAAKANYNILCFLHEDVRIHTKGWGEVLANTFLDKSIGLAGISGAVYKSAYPGTWAACEHNLYRTHSIQHFKNSTLPVETNNNPFNEKISSVAVIDGVFMATTKKIFGDYHFDDKLLKGFHCYDLDYSLQVAEKYKIVVTFDILLEHFSEGKLNEAWLKDSLLLHQKWSALLPKFQIKVNDKHTRTSDYLSLCCALNIALKYKGYNRFVASAFYSLTIKFYTLNKLNYSKTVVNYFSGKIKLIQ